MYESRIIKSTLGDIVTKDCHGDERLLPEICRFNPAGKSQEQPVAIMVSYKGEALTDWCLPEDLE